MTSVETQVDSSMARRLEKLARSLEKSARSLEKSARSLEKSARNLEKSADFEQSSVGKSTRMSTDKSLSASGLDAVKNSRITSSLTGPKLSYKSTPQPIVDGYFKKTSDEVRNV